ncbi:MAG: two-component regulator propeller domain-containing protein [Bacteroidota bacterium]
MKRLTLVMVIKSALYNLMLPLILLHTQTVSFAQHTFWDNKLCTSTITSIAKEGNDFWLTAFGGGLMKFNPNTSSTFFYNRHNSNIPSVCMSAVTVDSSGYKWIGTNNNVTGLVRFDGANNWICFNTSNCPLISNYINCLKVYGNDLWVGTRNGLAKFDGVNWTIFDSVSFAGNKFAVNGVSDIAVDSSGNIWIACPYIGLMYFNGVNWKVFTDSNSGINCGISNAIYTVTLDTSGNCLVGHGRGFSSFWKK